MKSIISGVFVFLIGAAATIYFLLYGGIVMVMGGLDPINATSVALGIVMVLLVGPGIWVSVVAAGLVGTLVAANEFGGHVNL